MSSMNIICKAREVKFYILPVRDHSVEYKFLCYFLQGILHHGFFTGLYISHLHSAYCIWQFQVSFNFINSFWRNQEVVILPYPYAIIRDVYPFHFNVVNRCYGYVLCVY